MGTERGEGVADPPNPPNRGGGGREYTPPPPPGWFFGSDKTLGRGERARMGRGEGTTEPKRAQRNSMAVHPFAITSGERMDQAALWANHKCKRVLSNFVRGRHIRVQIFEYASAKMFLTFVM